MARNRDEVVPNFFLIYMSETYNNRSVFKNRKTLRNNLTPQEIALWVYLKDSNLGFKFRRQNSVGPYILDFYCPSKKLAIEIDGSQHFEKSAEAYDEKRTQYLRSKGIQVVRFTNAEINTNMQGVLKKIQSVCSEPPRP